MKIIMVDLDGTLFDTKDVNYYSYSEALKIFGYELDYSYYCDSCNGKHYMDFLPQITNGNSNVLSKIHEIKKSIYGKYLKYAKVNKLLVDLLWIAKESVKIALVTTASKKNTLEILNYFGITDLFDLILTKDDIVNSKPNPEGYQKALAYFNISKEDALIFEDSDVGEQAAINCGVQYILVKGYN